MDARSKGYYHSPIKQLDSRWFKDVVSCVILYNANPQPSTQSLRIRGHIVYTCFSLKTENSGKMSENSGPALDRLAIISRHLNASPSAGVDSLSRNATSSDDSRPAPGGGRGTLTVLDNRSGKKYTVRRRGWLAGF